MRITNIKEPLHSSVNSIMKYWSNLPYSNILIPNPEYFDKKVIWFKHARTAGTSLKTVFHRKKLFFLNGFDPRDNKGNMLSVNDFTLSTDREIIDKYYKFTIVRNPFDRLVSAWKWAKTNTARGLGPFGMDSFENFIKNEIVDKDDNITNSHWEHQCSSLVNPHGKNLMVDYIGRFEKIEESINHILRIMGIYEEWNYKDLPVVNKSLKYELIRCKYPLSSDYSKWTPPYYREYYTRETRKIVTNIYKKDLELLNYKF